MSAETSIIMKNDSIDTIDSQVRESLQAFNAMVGELKHDLDAMASNYDHYAEVNRGWEQMLAKSQPVLPAETS